METSCPGSKALYALLLLSLLSLAVYGCKQPPGDSPEPDPDVESARPEPVEPAQPGHIERSQPGPVERSQPGPVERSQPGPVERSQPGPVAPAEPGPAEPAPTTLRTDRPSHPFASTISGAILTRELTAEQLRRRTIPRDLVAVDIRRAATEVVAPFGSLEVQVESTPEVSEEHLALLMSTLAVVPVDRRIPVDRAMLGREHGTVEPGSGEIRLPPPTPGTRPIRLPTEERRLEIPTTEIVEEVISLQHGEAEVRLPTLTNARRERFMLLPNDAWEMVRPNVFRLKPEYLIGEIAPADMSAASVGASTSALTGNWDRVEGSLTCRPTTETAIPLPYVGVEIAGHVVHADANGIFHLDAAVTDLSEIRVIYQGDVSSAGATSSMMVMNEWHNPWSEWVDTPTGSTAGTTLQLGTLQVDSLDCELFALGVEALDGYHGITSDSPPADALRIKRWWGVYHGTPYSYYDYVVIARNFLGDYPARYNRRQTIFHEFGHTVRHAADGDLGHWGWDNFRWAYARFHNGTEVFNEQYAFNEGWAQYWECTSPFAPTLCPSMPPGVPSVDYLDWNEMRIGERLLAMAAVVGHDTMVQVLIDNPGSIHRLWDFEERYCASVAVPNTYCTASGAPVRTKDSCPPEFHDDGATCRLDNIRAKPSYGRGVGTIPNGCDTGEALDAGLCYNDCADGYDGVGPVCWAQCPSGYHDDGAFCRRDVVIIGSDNSDCPWYDICGLTFAAGCSECPSGYHNDGCTCRIDAHIFAKDSYGRGVGTIPTDCPSGKEYDAGLCYPYCNSGYHGVGPVCWGSCDPGWDDHGATCYRSPNIIVKY